MATVAHPRVVHPRVETWEFDALQENRGWDMDYELIAGEAVLVPPIGESASMAQGELHIALRRWQDDTAEPGVLLQDVFVAPPGKNRLAPDITWWSGGAGHVPKTRCWATATRCAAICSSASSWPSRASSPPRTAQPATTAPDRAVAPPLRDQVRSMPARAAR
jgi:hypothetical protein